MVHGNSEPRTKNDELRTTNYKPVMVLSVAGQPLLVKKKDWAEGPAPEESLFP
jgi:hypothetical protein